MLNGEKRFCLYLSRSDSRVLRYVRLFDGVLSEPDEDGPRMVTDISAADLRSWSGAGPLPRARSQSGHSVSVSGSAAKMTHVVESAVRIEAWEVC